MSRAYHVAGNRILLSREEIELHLLQKINNSSRNIGTEIELFVTTPEGLPITFDQVELILSHLAEGFDSTLKRKEDGRIVGLHIPQLGDVSLEPGGQIELSTRPCRDLSELKRVNEDMRSALDRTAKFFDLRVKGQGHIPAFMGGEDMPRSRFAAYYRHCHREIGKRADGLIKTMKSTCSLQVNLDPMGKDFNEIYRALMLVDIAMALVQPNERSKRFVDTYASYFPEQTTPLFEAIGASSNEGLITLIVDRLLTLKVPFIPDQSPEGFKSAIDVFGSALTVSELMKRGLLSEEILDNALSLQLTMPNLRRHGVLETRSADSVQTVGELMRISSIYYEAAYDKRVRGRLLRHLKAIDPECLRKVFNARSAPLNLDAKVGKHLTVRDLIRETGVDERPKSKDYSPNASTVRGCSDRRSL